MSHICIYIMRHDTVAITNIYYSYTTVWELYHVNSDRLSSVYRSMIYIFISKYRGYSRHLAR